MAARATRCVHAQIASVFEFTGAIALGGEVAKTISGGIARPAYFNNDPEIFMFGACLPVHTATGACPGVVWPPASEGNALSSLQPVPVATDARAHDAPCLCAAP